MSRGRRAQAVGPLLACLSLPACLPACHHSGTHLLVALLVDKHRQAAHGAADCRQRSRGSRDGRGELRSQPRRRGPPASAPTPTEVGVLLGCDGLHEARDEGGPLLRAVPARDGSHRHGHRRPHQTALVAQARGQLLSHRLLLLRPHRGPLVLRRLGRPVLAHQLLQHGGCQLAQPRRHLAPRRQQNRGQRGGVAGAGAGALQRRLGLLPGGSIGAQGGLQQLQQLGDLLGSSQARRCHRSGL